MQNEPNEVDNLTYDQLVDLYSDIIEVNEETLIAACAGDGCRIMRKSCDTDYKWCIMAK